MYVETYETSSKMNFFFFQHAFYCHACHCSLCVISYKATMVKEIEYLLYKEFLLVHY